MPEAQDKVDGGVGLNSPHRVYHGADEVGEIERINAADITQEDFEKKYINRGMPVVISGAMDEWPAFKEGDRKWTLGFFKERYGDVKCPVDTSGKKELMSLAAYIDQFEQYKDAAASDPIPYLRTWYFADDVPELVDDFTPPPLFHTSDAFRKLPEDLQPPFQWLFFGPAGTQSKLHVDIWETDAWLGMLEGEKTFTLYHPAQRKYLERELNEWTDLMAPPNMELYPEQHKAMPAQTLLRAGEIIYIPRKWPHHAVAQSASISLTLNFAPIVSKSNILAHLMPYVKNRGRCQMLLGRRLRAGDNLMQLCIHGGTIKYRDLQDVLGSKKEDEEDEEDEEEEEEEEVKQPAGEGRRRRRIVACEDEDESD